MGWGLSYGYADVTNNPSRIVKDRCTEKRWRKMLYLVRVKPASNYYIKIEAQ